MSYCPNCETLSINGTMCHETCCDLSHIDFSWFEFAPDDDGIIVSIGEFKLPFTADLSDWSEFDPAAFLRNFVEDIADECEGRVIDELTKISDWSEEYHTEHSDEGDNYLSCCLDNHGQYRDLIIEYIRDEFDDCESISIDDDDIDRLVDGCEARPGHMFSSDRPGDGIVVDSWIVGEIEEQIELSHLVEQTGLPLDLILWVIESQRDHCVQFIGSDRDCCYLYINTDATWQAVVTDDAIEDLLSELVESEGGDV